MSCVLSGCAAVGPDYATPAAEVPARFVGGAGVGVRDVAGDAWWQSYQDRTLDGLVTRALAANLDVAKARARVAAAEADLRGTGIRRQFGGDLALQATRSGGDAVPTGMAESATLTASYVFDLFGGVRRGQERALAERDAAVFDVATARLAVLTSVVGRYIDARYYQEALALTRETIASRERTVELVREQFRAGLVSEIDVVRAESDLDGAKADVPPLLQGFERNIFALATLLAEPAEPLFCNNSERVPRSRDRLATYRLASRRIFCATGPMFAPKNEGWLPP